MDDVARLRAALRAVEAGAKTQPWDRQRPWRVATHVGWHGEVPLVDLHDLKVKHAKAAVRTALDELPALYRRSIDWPFAIISRTINTRGTEDDVSVRFEREIRKRDDKAKRMIAKVIDEAVTELPHSLRDTYIDLLDRLGMAYEHLLPPPPEEDEFEGEE